MILSEVISLIAGNSSDAATADWLLANVTDSTLAKGATSQGSICFLLAERRRRGSRPAWLAYVVLVAKF
jgi:hypothetical protein